MLRSNSKSLGNHVVSPEEEKERQKKNYITESTLVPSDAEKSVTTTR